MGFDGLRLGLGALPRRMKAKTRLLSAENPTGEKGRAAMAVPDSSNPDLPFASCSEHLGPGWKANPYIQCLSGETRTIMDIDGPGVIQHIWIATEPTFGRTLVLRFYWDDEDEPSIEVPMGDFFALGHDTFAPVNSLPVVANPAYGLNCYWPMPFREHARITVSNDSPNDCGLFAYEITYAETEVDDDLTYLHALWRRDVTDPKNPDYEILPRITGAGHYVGTFLAWTPLRSGWWGEGEMKFYIDGDEEHPTIAGTAVEDYFGGAWSFPQVYSTPFLGNTLRDDPPPPPPNHPNPPAQDIGPRHSSLYRWHIMDPICFDEDLRVTVQALGWYPDMKFRPLDDDIASVAFWYQTEPHTTFGEMLPWRERLSR